MSNFVKLYSVSHMIFHDIFWFNLYKIMFARVGQQGFFWTINPEIEPYYHIRSGLFYE